MARRFYSNNAVETTLQSGIGSGDSGLVVLDSTGYPAVPFVIVVEPDTANEEFVLVGAKSGTTFSTLTRAFDGSAAAAHNAGSVIKHVAVALDFTEMWTHKHLAADGHTPIDFATAGASAPGDTAAAGSAVTASRSDHRHSREAAAASGDTYVYKTADEVVTSSVTLQDDNHLFFTLEANKIYAFEAFLEWTVPGVTPDIKWEWVEPDGTWSMGYSALTGAGTGATQRLNDATGAITTATAAPDGSANVAFFIGVIKAGGAGGTFKLQWAQGTSDAGATTMKLGSWLRYRKLN